MPSGQLVPVNGAELRGEEAGDGLAVVLVHSGVTDSRMWDAQFAVLAERYLVVRCDQRGDRCPVQDDAMSRHTSEGADGETGAEDTAA